MGRAMKQCVAGVGAQQCHTGTVSGVLSAAPQTVRLRRPAPPCGRRPGSDCCRRGCTVGATRAELGAPEGAVLSGIRSTARAELRRTLRPGLRAGRRRRRRAAEERAVAAGSWVGHCAPACVQPRKALGPIGAAARNAWGWAAPQLCSRVLTGQPAGNVVHTMPIDGHCAACVQLR